MIIINLYSLNNEDKYLKNNLDIPSSFGIHSDLSYGFYMVDVDSSEINSAIDYSVFEATVGISYVYNSWMLGVYSKILLDEVSSNMYVVNRAKKLNNHAKIKKKESAFYINYILLEEEKNSWRINIIYRESKLNAKDLYHSFNQYESYFNYGTRGVASSLVYAHQLNKKSSYNLSLGVLHTQAKVKIKEVVNTFDQDAFIDTKSSATGLKIAFGYNYYFTKNIIFNIRNDSWWLNFSKLNVNSQVGDFLPKAKLREESLSSYFGVTWQF